MTPWWDRPSMSLGVTRGSEADVSSLRFCAYQYQHLPLADLRPRWREADELGFDVLWNCDTVVEPDRPRHPMFDGPATLTLMAAETTRIRWGPWSRACTSATR